ncbi:helix-turn-helix transcriptional regulator [[Pasteurella] aerogenes]|nr:helix-turn-helix transcriptional regulator [[Pasteurella] aerogenes]MDY4595070.1 helix-turn-helix transcriptional regulator [[Pasteurella] aerogenes]VEG72523.1 Helix-turn-helix domain [[Pasteurella] aerogenes]
MNEKEYFAKNLREILEQKGIEARPCVLEREFHLHHYGKDITQQAIKKWLDGTSLPTAERLQTLADWLQVDLTELVSEERAYKIRKKNEKQKSNKNLWELLQKNYEDQDLIEKWFNLPPEQKKVVREVIMAMDKAYRG